MRWLFSVSAHHSEKWQQHAMYVGLHFPGNRSGKKRRHHRRHHKKRDENTEQEPAKPRK